MMVRRSSTGGDLFWSCLYSHGATEVFGLPGTQSVPLYETLRKSKLRTVLTTHESAATFMANGYYRACGKPAVVMAIPGPGFTNTLTGIAEAKEDSAGLIVVTVGGSIASGHQFGLQDIDQESIVNSISKAHVSIGCIGEIAEKASQAYLLATSGEPGPVIIDLKPSLITEEVDNVDPEGRLAASYDGDKLDLTEILNRLADANKVMMLLGQGAAGSPEFVASIVRQLKSPVITTCSGRGVISEREELSVCPDISATDISIVNRLIDESDLVLALGCKFSHNGSAGFRLILEKSKLIHIDRSPDVLNKDYPASLAIEADLNEFLPALSNALQSTEKNLSGWDDKTIAKYRIEVRNKRDFESGPVISGSLEISWQEFFETLSDSFPANMILVTDSGMHQMLARAFAVVRSSNGFIAPSDFQSMGFGVPAAIGAKLATPDREVVLICGDGGFNMTGFELLTAVRERLNLTILLFNDGNLGLIRRQQIRDTGTPFSVTNHNPNYIQIAEALGATYYRFDGDTRAILQECQQRAGVKIVEIVLKDSTGLKTDRARRVIKETAKTIIPQSLRQKLRSSGGRD